MDQHNSEHQGRAWMAQKEIRWEPRLPLVGSLKGDKVVNVRREDLRNIEDSTIDLETARIASAVLWAAEIYAYYGHKPFWN